MELRELTSAIGQSENSNDCKKKHNDATLSEQEEMGTK